MKIQAISSWQNGQEKLGTEFNLRIINDNLLDSASFYYNICSEEVSHIATNIIAPPSILTTILDGVETETEVPEVTENVKIVTTYAQQLVDGNLSISGQDYQDWGKATDINLWAYEWAAAKLNLVLVTE